MEENQRRLKLSIQQFGALRPEAWELIVQLQGVASLKAGQSLIRREGTLAYVAQGLLKEYNTSDRVSPSVINFIGEQGWLLTRGHNQHHYLKACIPTIIFYWNFDDLMHLYQEFNELKPIYNTVCSGYEKGIEFRQLILEQGSSIQRIRLFRDRFHHQLNYIKKKDIANYLQINYTHFLHINSHLP